MNMIVTLPHLLFDIHSTTVIKPTFISANPKPSSNLKPT